MEYVAIQVLLSACIEIVYLRAVVRTMHLRSNRIYLAIMFADFLIGTTLKELDILHTLNSIIGFTAYFVVPVFLSSDKMITRIMQASSLYFVLLITDLFGGAFFTLIGGGTVIPDYLGADNISLVVTTYLVIFSLNVLIFGALIARSEHASKEDQPPLEYPAVILIPASMALYHISLSRSVDITNSGLLPGNLLPLVASCCISLLTIYLILWTARRESETQRELAEHAIAARRVRHTRREVEGMTWRAEGMSSLRHDLANQVRDIARLAEAGETAEAGRRLSKLSGQARVLSGGWDA